MKIKSGSLGSVVITDDSDNTLAVFANPNVYIHPHVPDAIIFSTETASSKNSRDFEIKHSDISEPVTADVFDLLDTLQQSFVAGNALTDLGWVNIIDTTYTSGAPLTLSNGARTLLDLNADVFLEDYAPNGFTGADFYDNATSKITPLGLGDSYIYRISLTAVPAQNDKTLILDLDIGGTQGIILQRSTRLSKGAGTENFISTTNSIFTLGTFVANGGELYLTCDGACDIYGISLFIQRVTLA